MVVDDIYGEVFRGEWGTCVGENKNFVALLDSVWFVALFMGYISYFKVQY